MERPYLNKWQQYLLSEAKGPEKPPYFKNIYGSTNNAIKANTKEVAKTMSRILKQTVTIEIPNMDAWPENFIACNNSKGEPIYVEYDEDGKCVWERRNWTADMSYDWGSKGSDKYIWNYDKDWHYLRTAHMEDGMKKRYFVIKQDESPIKMNSQLINPQSSGDWVELRPGTKAYEAVKHKVFKD
jgi:hypothetical protein